MAEIKFNVLEKADATGFNIYKTGGADAVTGQELTLIDPQDDTYTYIFSELDAVEFNAGLSGLEINVSDITGGSSFPDGIYKFSFDTVADSSHTEGFAAVITLEVIKESLSYRPRLTKAVKEYIQEKIMLLNNLSYAAAISDEEAFNSNLEILQRMR